MVRHDRRSAALALAVLVIGLVSAGCAGPETPARSEEPAAPARAAPPGTETHSPLAGQSLYVEPRSSAALQAARWRSEGKTHDAAAMARLAARPVAVWMADGNDVTRRVRSLTRRAAGAGKSALLVAYYIPRRDCGGYSAGGARSAGSYRRWIRALSSGLGDRRATVILEPDAVAQSAAGCLAASARAERYALLSFAVHTLAVHPRVNVYVDAGNAGWIRPASRLVGPLRRAGIGAADGFALNVSSFYRTKTTVPYGRALSARLGGAHFVIDTSRNGNGAHRGSSGKAPQWCNPPGRALGADPTTVTGQALVDAYLWIKVPGRSDGACRPGAPRAGVWWPSYALALTRNRERPRPSTRPGRD